MQEGNAMRHEKTARLEHPTLPLPPWRSEGGARTHRGPAPKLDRARIVARALEVLDAEGVAAVSFRRLADDLGVTPMSLYWHVADKAELLELVGHAILDEIALPAPAGDWKDELRDVHRGMFDVFLRHPNATDILAGRARYGPAGLAAFERILEILLAAGFTPEAAFDAYQSLYLFTLGFVATSSRSPEFVAIQRSGVQYMATLPVDRFPAIRAVVPVIGRRPPRAQLELGLEVVIEGIARRLAPGEPAAG
ncbi:MAG TPA: TetR/AcrR family transcriptional regulator C-terminal domain-containing protein [Candidatus Limnocylindrales bacterium]|nr:TetR/AcrR family transcriptional regulator C-terminal domain-containing protein [Candidatus Limnocylindrales bacterium]